MTKPSSILVDTNVWLDLYIASRPGHKHAIGLVDAALANETAILYAVSSIKDAYYIFGAALKQQAREAQASLSKEDTLAIRELAWGCLNNMRDLGTAVGVDESDVWIAEKHRPLHDDFEDNLMIAAALRSNADYLVTSDQELLKHSPVAALSPEDMIALMKA